MANNKRIKAFVFTRDGITQQLSEEDYFTRADFLKDRKDFIKAGIKIIDIWTKEPYIPYERR